jgi:proline racemase
MPTPGSETAGWNPWPLTWCPHSFLIRGVNSRSPDSGQVPVDLVCVGGFFAMVSARSVGIDLIPENSHRLISLGMAVIEAANRAFEVYHPNGRRSAR